MQRNALKAVERLLDAVARVKEEADDSEQLRAAWDELSFMTERPMCNACVEDSDVCCTNCGVPVGEVETVIPLNVLHEAFTSWCTHVLERYQEGGEHWGVWVERSAESAFGAHGAWATYGGQVWTGDKDEAVQYAQKMRAANSQEDRDNHFNFTPMPVKIGTKPPEERGN